MPTPEERRPGVPGERERLAEQFEEHRSHVRAVAYRMLGSVSDAEDAVQEAWLRLARTSGGGIEDLRGWLTTVTGRICLDILRRRGARAEQPLEISAGMLPREAAGDGRTSPEDEALLADSVGLALYVVMDALTPAERVSFVLHDVFEVPFGAIATILGRSTAATKMLALLDEMAGALPPPAEIVPQQSYAAVNPPSTAGNEVPAPGPSGDRDHDPACAHCGKSYAAVAPDRSVTPADPTQPISFTVLAVSLFDHSVLVAPDKFRCFSRWLADPSPPPDVLRMTCSLQI